MYDSPVRTIWLTLCLVACARTTPPPATPATAKSEEPPPASTSTTKTETPAHVETPPVKEPPAAEPLYTLEDALGDVQASPLTYLGTGEWYGLDRVNACIYKNDRVFVVNVYCTKKETNAFGLAVLSPKRGRAYIYAEAKKPISKLKRGDYFTFTGETNPAVVDAKLPALEIAFTDAQVRAWEEKRARHFIGGCAGGTELGKPHGGCHSSLAAQADTWSQRNKHFLDDPPAEWYRLVQQLTERAKTEGKAVNQVGG